jgi:hypothetical protein
LLDVIYQAGATALSRNNARKYFVAGCVLEKVLLQEIKAVFIG